MQLLRSACLLLLCASSLRVAGATDGILRGVDPARHSEFLSRVHSGGLACNNQVLSTHHINDDFCDCEDGSDEPGTSACTTGRFFCANKGFKATTLFSSRVNDGVCDCCDGSDEWNGPKACDNTCERDGALYREQQRERFAMLKQGWAKKQELMGAGKALREVREKEQHEVMAQLEVAKADVEEKQKVKDEQEAEEARQREVKQQEFDAEEDARIEELTREQEAAKQAEEAMAGDADAAIAVEVGAEGTTAQFNNNNNNDGGGKAGDGDNDDFEMPIGESEEEADDPVLDAVGGGGFDMNDFPQGVPSCIAWRQTGQCKGDGPREPDQDRQCNEVIANGASGFCECVGVENKAFGCEHEPLDCDTICAGGVGTSHPAAANNNNDNEDLAVEFSEGAEADASAEGENLLERRTMPAFSTEEANEARKVLKEAEDHKRSLESKLTSLANELTANHGQGDAFLPLRGQCAEISMNQYKYEVCLYTEAKQHDGHTWVKLGAFESIDDAENPKQMKFAHGQRCWNGPDRSAIVDFECGPEFKVLSADEPEKCVYHFVAQLPAVCEEVIPAE